MAQKTDILEKDRWFTNSDYQINCFIKQADGVTVQNISGWVFSWLLKKRLTDPDVNAILAKTSGSGITTIDGAAGHVRVTIIADDTDGVVRAGVYVHEVKRTDTGFETPVIQGIAILRQSAHIT